MRGNGSESWVANFRDAYGVGRVFRNAGEAVEVATSVEAAVAAIEVALSDRAVLGCVLQKGISVSSHVIVNRRVTCCSPRVVELTVVGLHAQT